MLEPTDPFAPPIEIVEPAPDYRPPVPTADLEDHEFATLDGPATIQPLSTILAATLLCSPLTGLALQGRNWIRMRNGARAARMTGAALAVVSFHLLASSSTPGPWWILSIPVVIVGLVLDHRALRSAYPDAPVVADLGEAFVSGVVIAFVVGWMATLRTIG